MDLWTMPCAARAVPVQAAYLQGAFDVTLPRCPKCGMTLVPGELADGKMAEVEGLLEDK